MGFLVAQKESLEELLGSCRWGILHFLERLECRKGILRCLGDGGMGIERDQIVVYELAPKLF